MLVMLSKRRSSSPANERTTRCGTTADQISIEAAQPRLDLGVLADLSPKSIMLGVLDLGDPAIESVELVADRIRNGLKDVAPERLVPAPDCGMKYIRAASPSS